MSGILHLQYQIFPILRYPHKHPAGGFFLFHPMNAGILHKSNQRQPGNPELSAFAGRADFVAQPVAKAVFLQFQISLYKVHLVLDGHIIVAPCNILPLHHRQLLHHIGRLIFLLDHAVHADTLQGIEQEMRVYLAVQCQQFGLLPGNILLLTF